MTEVDRRQMGEERWQKETGPEHRGRQRKERRERGAYRSGWPTHASRAWPQHTPTGLKHGVHTLTRLWVCDRYRAGGAGHDGLHLALLFHPRHVISSRVSATSSALRLSCRVWWTHWHEGGNLFKF